MTLLKKSALLVLGLTVSVFADDICNGAYQAGDYQRAGDCYIGQLKKGKTIKNYFRAGYSLAEQGRYKEALSYLNNAENKAQNVKEFGYVYNILSVVYGNLGNKKMELSYDMKFLDIALKEGDQNTIATAYNNIGQYYQEAKETDKALEFFNKSLTYSSEEKKAPALHNMALCYADLEKYVEEEEYYKKAIDIEIQTGNFLGLCRTKSNLGEFYLGQKRFDEGLNTLEDTKDICHNAGDISFEAKTLSMLALYYNVSGKPSVVNEYMSRATNLAQKSGDYSAINQVKEISKIINSKNK